MARLRGFCSVWCIDREHVYDKCRSMYGEIYLSYYTDY